MKFVRNNYIPLLAILVATVGAVLLSHFGIVHAFADTAAAPAASTSTPLVVNYGTFVTAFLAWGRDIFVSAAALVVPFVVPAALRQYVTSELIGNAVDYAIAAVDGAVAGKSVTIDVANQLIEKAAAYILARGPSTFDRLGDDLRPMILARLGSRGVIAPNATDVALDAKIGPKADPGVGAK